jgi:hypothetical protein
MLLSHNLKSSFVEVIRSMLPAVYRNMYNQVNDAATMSGQQRFRVIARRKSSKPYAGLLRHRIACCVLVGELCGLQLLLALCLNFGCIMPSMHCPERSTLNDTLQCEDDGLSCERSVGPHVYRIRPEAKLKTTDETRSRATATAYVLLLHL